MGDAAYIAEGISHAFDWTHVGVTKGMVAVLLISLAAHLLIPLRLMYVGTVLLVLSIPTTPFRAVTDIIQVSGLLVRVCIVPAPAPDISIAVLPSTLPLAGSVQLQFWLAR